MRRESYVQYEIYDFLRRVAISQPEKRSTPLQKSDTDQYFKNMTSNYIAHSFSNIIKEKWEQY